METYAPQGELIEERSLLKVGGQGKKTQSLLTYARVIELVIT